MSAKPKEDDPMTTLRQVSQPSRELVRWLQRQFQQGKLPPGGKVLLRK